MVTAYTFRGEPDSWPSYAPIGRAIQNCAVVVTDAAGHSLPPGAQGEIRVIGLPVAEGYLQCEPQDAVKFGRRGVAPLLYRTGDVGMVDESGELVFCGRLDHQVKLRGFRVELDEVQLVVERHPAVSECFICVHDRNETQVLAAYVTAIATFDIVELRRPV